MMSNWQIVDLALCVGEGIWRDAATGDTRPYGPKRGQCHKVECIVVEPKLALGFAKWPNDAFVARHFIKVTPPADMIEQERREQVPT